MIKSRGAAAVAPQSFHGARRCGYETSARPRYHGLPPEDLPRAESLRDCLARVAPCFADRIRPDIEAGLTVVVVAHGNSLRALVQYLDGIPNDAITELNIPTATPLVYEFDDDMRPLAHPDAIAPLTGRYLGDLDAIRARIEGVKSQTK